MSTFNMIIHASCIYFNHLHSFVSYILLFYASPFFMCTTHIISIFYYSIIFLNSVRLVPPYTQ